MAKHRNPAYTEEFRKEAVRLACLPGRTAVSVAQELGISAQQIRNCKHQFTRLIAEARMGIFEYIEVYYNRNRKHSALGYVSPVAFESM